MMWSCAFAICTSFCGCSVGKTYVKSRNNPKIATSCPMVEYSSPRPGRYPNLKVENDGTHWRSDEDSELTEAISGAGRTRAMRSFSSSASLRRNISMLGGWGGEDAELPPVSGPPI